MIWVCTWKKRKRIKEIEVLLARRHKEKGQKAVAI